VSKRKGMVFSLVARGSGGTFEIRHGDGVAY